MKPFDTGDDRPHAIDGRIDYGGASLVESEVTVDPIVQFERWFEEARRLEDPEANAMTLATADAEGRPSARIVLLRSIDRRGFVFHSNYTSRKGLEIADRPDVALVFYWGRSARQVRVDGRAERLTASESDAYFTQRPRGHQLSAWGSRQSSTVPDRAALEREIAAAAARFVEGEIPRPQFWGGYRVVPTVIEFWQGRSDRVHDRLRYRREADGWRIERLSP